MAHIETFDDTTQKMKLLQGILAVRTNLKNVETADNGGDPIEIESSQDDLTDTLDFLNWEFGCLMGYEFLEGMRRFWGTQIAMHNSIQEKYYKMQKTRYEHCKRVVGCFTSDDREFIEHFKALNEKHRELQWACVEMREIISDIVEAAFPNAPFDLGWDEVWKPQGVQTYAGKYALEEAAYDTVVE